MIGRPGTSKTLSMSILCNTMRGSRSNSEFFQQLPRLQPFSVQCSGQITSTTITECWNEASEFQKHAGADTISVVMLDEIGLAQHGEHMPLKVLHSLLAESPPPVAFVGLSNWALDGIPSTLPISKYYSHHFLPS
jgi:E3 ubiquitin-protein ligase RNF213